MATDNVTFVLVQGTEQRERELPKTTTLQDLAELLRSDAEIATTFVFDAAKPAMLSGYGWDMELHEAIGSGGEGWQLGQLLKEDGSTVTLTLAALPAELGFTFVQGTKSFVLPVAMPVTPASIFEALKGKYEGDINGVCSLQMPGKVPGSWMTVAKLKPDGMDTVLSLAHSKIDSLPAVMQPEKPSGIAQLRVDVPDTLFSAEVASFGDEPEDMMDAEEEASGVGASGESRLLDLEVNKAKMVKTMANWQAKAGKATEDATRLLSDKDGFVWSALSADSDRGSRKKSNGGKGVCRICRDKMVVLGSSMDGAIRHCGTDLHLLKW